MILTVNDLTFRMLHVDPDSSLSGETRSKSSTDYSNPGIRPDFCVTVACKQTESDVLSPELSCVDVTFSHACECVRKTKFLLIS